MPLYNFAWIIWLFGTLQQYVGWGGGADVPDGDERDNKHGVGRDAGQGGEEEREGGVSGDDAEGGGTVGDAKRFWSFSSGRVVWFTGSGEADEGANGMVRSDIRLGDQSEEGDGEGRGREWGE